MLFLISLQMREYLFSRAGEELESFPFISSRSYKKLCSPGFCGDGFSPCIPPISA